MLNLCGIHTKQRTESLMMVEISLAEKQSFRLEVVQPYEKMNSRLLFSNSTLREFLENWKSLTTFSESQTRKDSY